MADASQTSGTTDQPLLQTTIGADLDATAVRVPDQAHYKIPRYAHVVDEFPMTVTGKVRKVEMRERAAELLGS